MEKILYALITTHCNLSCPYCDVKNKEEFFNKELFIKKLTEFDGRIILFGGEPTLYPNRLIDVFLDNPILNKKITSISTNLISINDKLLTIYQLIGYLSTSWNTDRFTSDQYKTWLENINIVKEKIPDVKINILVTMTDNLLKLSPNDFNDIISQWNKDAIDNIKFEHYIGDENTPKYFEKCDNWLCDIYKNWNKDFKMSNVNDILNWYHDCTNVFTIYPNGNIKNGCPHAVGISIPVECYSCERSSFCRPCQLQKYCSFPKKFYDLIKNGG